MDYKDEVISAFAFKTGKLIEELINERTNNLRETNILLEAKILNFRSELNNSSLFSKGWLALYDNHFGISEFKHGKI